MKNIFSIFLIICVVTSCGVPKKEYKTLEQTCDSLKNVVTALHEEIEELKNGEERLVSLAKNSINAGKFILASQYIEQLKNKHPESKEIINFEKLKPELETKIIEEKEHIEKLRKDSIRLANINNLGIWKTSYYVDEYGEATQTPFVKTELYGTFSNSATTDSRLKILFLIDKDDARIQLYEYAGNHPIKGEGVVSFRIKDSNGKEYKISAFNDSAGNTSVKTEHLETFKNILLNGGELKFYAIAGEYTRSVYNFTIPNADFLENALIKSGIQK